MLIYAYQRGGVEGDRKGPETSGELEGVHGFVGWLSGD